jgi:hypothetical protein
VITLSPRSLPRSVRRTQLAAVSLALLGASAFQLLQAQAVSYKHLGAASCSSSQCHGKRDAQAAQKVALNEYTIWFRDDRHAQAYRNLNLPRSKAIAAKLGIASAVASPTCLNCHADNVPQQGRGPKFQITDGVSCEACHGGAERWLDKHSQKGATHAANVALGMYPTESPSRRAQLCVSCHLGRADKFVTHTLVAAGHPRLRFELDTYTTNQPPHYRVDAGYIARKGKPDETVLLLAGQFECEQRYLALLQSAEFLPPGLIPEPALYDCFACHHPADKLRWTAERVGSGVRVGSPRLQREHLVILEAAAEALGDSAAVSYLRGAEASLTRAGQSDTKAVRASASELSSWLQSHGPWIRRSFSREESAAIRRTLARYAGADRGSDYLVAEQMYLAIEALSYALQDRDARRAQLDALYNALAATPYSFDPDQFARTARGVERSF